MLGGILCLGILVSACGKQSGIAEVGQNAPAITLKDFSGTEYTLDQFKGKLVLLDFWASWCPPCRSSIPKLEEIHAAYSDRDDFLVVGINLDQIPTQAEQFIRDHNIGYLTLQGGSSTVSQDYGVRGIPAFFLIDADGVIVKKYTGYFPGLEQQWKKDIDELLQ